MNVVDDWLVVETRDPIGEVTGKGWLDLQRVAGVSVTGDRRQGFAIMLTTMLGAQSWLPGVWPSIAAAERVVVEELLPAIRTVKS